MKTAIQQNRVELVKEVSEFLSSYNSKFLTWDEGRLEEFVDFYCDRAAIGIVRLKGDISGVGMARTVKRSDMGDLWDFDDVGDTIWIQEITVTHTPIIPMLWDMMVKRFGKRPYVAGRRHNVVRVWPFEEYDSKMNLLLGKGI